MPIPVTCPECQYHFLVGDEFAGRPGRCPECAAIIHVPGSDSHALPPPAHESHDPSPYGSPRSTEAFDDFPSRLRRRRREPDDWERDERDDYDDRRRDRSSEDRPRTFDPQARAAAWGRVHKGLGSVQIAVILYFFGQLLQTGFILIRGVDKANGNALPDSGEIAVGIGGLVVVTAAGLFWLFGRAAGTRVPYVPARGWARASFYLVLAAFGSLVGFCCTFVTAFAAMVQQGPNPGAALLLVLSLMVMGLGMLVLVAAEVTGLVSLAKIGDGLRDSAAAAWARRSLVLLMVLIGLLMAGLCGFVIYAGQHAKQKGPAANQPANQNNPVVPKGKGKGNGPAAPNGQPQQPQQPNPFDDDALDPTTQFAFQAAMIGLILIYLLHYSVALQKARRAIRAEIHRLTGADEHAGHTEM
jgi:hypothetical protein